MSWFWLCLHCESGGGGELKICMLVQFICHFSFSLPSHTSRLLKYFRSCGKKKNARGIYVCEQFPLTCLFISYIKCSMAQVITQSLELLGNYDFNEFCCKMNRFLLLYFLYKICNFVYAFQNLVIYVRTLISFLNSFIGCFEYY